MIIKVRDVLMAAGLLVIAALVWMATWFIQRNQHPGINAVTAVVQTLGITDEQKAEASARAWVKDTFADPEAELRALSPLYDFDGGQLRTAMVRVRNQMGGWIFAYYVLQMDSAAKITFHERADAYAQMIARNHRRDKDMGIDKVFAFLHASRLPPEMSRDIHFGSDIKD